MILNKRW